jgi:hypothetical protein
MNVTLGRSNRPDMNRAEPIRTILHILILSLTNRRSDMLRGVQLAARRSERSVAP